MAEAGKLLQGSSNILGLAVGSRVEGLATAAGHPSGCSGFHFRDSGTRWVLVLGLPNNGEAATQLEGSFNTMDEKFRSQSSPRPAGIQEATCPDRNDTAEDARRIEEAMNDGQKRCKENRNLEKGATLTGEIPTKKEWVFPTPSNRRIPQCSQLEESVDPQKIASLMCKQWKLHSVTPLYRFSHRLLNDYSRDLAVFIAAEKQKGTAGDTKVELDVEVSVTTLLGFKGRERDPGAILIELSPKSQCGASTSEAKKVLWSGWFCCTFGEPALLDSLPEMFTCLPLFLANGNTAFTAVVGSWFQKTFGCCISDCAISSRDLSWMAAMWTGYDVQGGQQMSTELNFSVPIQPHSLDISYAIHPEDARALWNDIHKNADEVTEKEVELFLKCLYSHFFRHFKIHLSATKLVQVSTSVASADCDGKVKFRCSDHLTQVLALLTELAINQIQF
ncbi:centromere protein L-like [Ambystoma mexicanum]|uniref:centromere protein L-like n=1 Tax=Ambystoma mexicanum TaxID=8296 RepID=UPI0037E8080A